MCICPFTTREHLNMLFWSRSAHTYRTLVDGCPIYYVCLKKQRSALCQLDCSHKYQKIDRTWSQQLIKIQFLHSVFNFCISSYLFEIKKQNSFEMQISNLTNRLHSNNRSQQTQNRRKTAVKKIGIRSDQKAIRNDCRMTFNWTEYNNQANKINLNSFGSVFASSVCIYFVVETHNGGEERSHSDMAVSFCFEHNQNDRRREASDKIERWE